VELGGPGRGWYDVEGLGMFVPVGTGEGTEGSRFSPVFLSVV
jgi:hypothetical protein